MCCIKVSFRESICYILSDDEDFIAKIKVMLRGFKIVSCGCFEANDAEKIINVKRIMHQKYECSCGDMVNDFSEKKALGFVIRYVLEIIGRETPNCLFLHGGCIEYKGETYCFLGKTKSGKSTLTHYFCENIDCKYLTDDLICLNEKNECIPFLKPIFLRENKYIGRKTESIVIEYQDDVRYCLVPRCLVDLSENYKIDNIVILERNLGENPKLYKLSGAEAFMSIWGNMHNSDNMAKKRRVSIELAKSANVYHLQYNEISIDFDDILKLFNK